MSISAYYRSENKDFTLAKGDCLELLPNINFKFDMIFAPLPSTDGIGLALYNRMIRAAAHKILKFKK